MEATKSDDIVFKALGWMHARRKPLIIVGAVLVVGGCVLGLYNWKQGENENDANGALFAVPVGPDLRLAGTGGEITDLAKNYPSTPAGEIARAVVAENLFVRGDYHGAEQAFSGYLNDYPGGTLAPQATLGVAASLEAQGKTNDALAAYQKVVQSFPSELSVAEPARLTVARLAEAQNRFDLAFSEYRELANSPMPNDPWSGEARERLELLVGKHPELLKVNTTQTSPAGLPALGKPGVPATAPAAPAQPAATMSAAPAATMSAAPAAPTAASNAPAH